MRKARIVKRVVSEGAAAQAAASSDAAKLLGHTEREEFEAAVLAGAVSFSATRFMGRGRYDTREAPTLDGAREHAKAMGVDRVMIYAINAAGRQVLVEAGGRPIDNAGSPTRVL
jgi:hypothetical protein